MFSYYFIQCQQTNDHTKWHWGSLLPVAEKNLLMIMFFFTDFEKGRLQSSVFFLCVCKLYYYNNYEFILILFSEFLFYFICYSIESLLQL